MNILDKLNIKYNNIDLYITAVTHSSYTNENPTCPDYERLEFLGDAVLEISISDYLYNSLYLEEGVMTRMRSTYVCEEACATYAKEIGLDKEIKVGSGEEVNETITADVFEAFVAALYLDQGFFFAKKFVLDIITSYIDRGIDFLHDYKSVLQEKVQTEKKSVIYEIVKEEGPAHNKKFTAIVKVDDIIMGTGIGCSKKAAEQAAARDTLSKEAK